MPGKEVQKVKIPGSMKFIKSFIGKNLFQYKLDNNTILFAENKKDDEISREEFNRIVNGDVIVGSFLVVSVKNNKLVSMKRKSIRRYTNMFKLRKHKRKVHFFQIKYLEEYKKNKKKAEYEDESKEKMNASKLVA